MGLSDNKAKMYYGPVPSYQFMTEAVTQSEWQCEIKDCVTIFSSLHAYFICRYLNMYVFSAPRDGTTTVEFTAVAWVSLHYIRKGKKGIKDSGDISEMKICSSGDCFLGLVK